METLLSFSLRDDGVIVLISNAKFYMTPGSLLGVLLCAVAVKIVRGEDPVYTDWMNIARG